MPCKTCGLTGHYAKTCKKKTIQMSKLLNVVEVENVVIENVEKKKIKTTYYCYILQQKDNPNSLNYIGYTVNYTRRLRQHNCIIKGGAYFTKNRGPWEFLAVMTCPSWNAIRAMQVEWLAKHPTRTRKTPRCFYGSLGRINSLIEIFNRIPAEEEISMFIHDSFYSRAMNLHLPQNVKIYAELSGLITNNLVLESIINNNIKL